MSAPLQGKSLRSPLGRARGLGSAKEGTAHWWAQRVTAVALVPLTLWFVVNLIALAGAPRIDVLAWLASPVVAVLMLLLVAAVFRHAQLGLQVVIEDYVHAEGVKVAALMFVNGASLLLGALAAFSILKLAFGG
jgi:succinate dehydrogenase / fumarate reductase membrane anchor subunit